MKRQSIFFLCLLAAGGLFFLCTCKSNTSTSGDVGTPAFSGNRLPQDPFELCYISKDSFQAWFSFNRISQDGPVTPANSVLFPHNDNCDFYQWGERMFLWMTSAAPDYGIGENVLESPVFYTVVGDSLVAHQPGIPLAARSALQKNGPNRLPVYTDGKGAFYEVQFHKPGEKVFVKTAAGQIVELGPVQKNPAGQVLLKGKNGQSLENVTFVTTLDHPGHVLHGFSTPGGPVFLDNNAKPINTYINQATGDALMARNGSLVYYITLVNDMYAFYRSAVADTKSKYHMSGIHFPTDSLSRDSITAYARSIGYKAPADSNALTIEVKSSWVLADSLTDLNTKDYVTIDAIVPTYKKINDRLWVPLSQKRVRLAMVGIHIVGSVAGHPEMVWATFEHDNNTPDTTYQYYNASRQVITVPADTGKWRFSSADGAPYNISHISVGDDGYSLRADSIYTISPSNTQRSAPFGVAFTGTPNQQYSDSIPAVSNSEIIGINNAIINQIPGNDVRKRYHLIGATWTFGGTAPSGRVYRLDTTAGSSIGTSVLANSTMETYIQRDTTSCFTCHSNHNSLLPGHLSHIFGSIHPLVPKQH